MALNLQVSETRKYLILGSGSAFHGGEGGQPLIVDVKLDGHEVGQFFTYANAGMFHLAFPTIFIEKNLDAGEHQIDLEPRAGTIIDFNDKFHFIAIPI